MSLLGHKPIGYGIILTESSIVVARAVRTRHGFKATLLSDGIPSRDVSPALLRTESSKLYTTVAGILPTHDGTLRWVHTPFSSSTKALRVIPALLDTQIPFSIESCEFAPAYINRTGAGTVDILVAAARREDINRVLHSYEERDVHLDILEHEGVVAWECFLSNRPEVNAESWLVAIAFPHRTTLIVGRPDAEGLRAARGLRIGAMDWADPATGEAHRREFANRVRQMLLTEAPGSLGTEKWGWCWIPCCQVNEETLEKLHQELQRVAPFQFVRLANGLQEMALLLAQRALLEEGSRCNLLRGRLQPPKWRERHDRRVTLTSSSMALAGLLLVVASAGLRVSSITASKRLENRIREIAEYVTGKTRVPRGLEVLEAQRAIDARAGAREVLGRVFSDSTGRDLAACLTFCRDVGLEVHSISFSPEEFTLRGRAQSLEKAQQLVSLIENRGYSVQHRFTPVPAPGTGTLVEVQANKGSGKRL